MFRIVVRYINTGTRLALKPTYPTRDAAEAEGARRYANKKNIAWHTEEIEERK